MSKEKNVTVSVKGIALYPKKEEGVMKYALMISSETALALNDKVSDVFPYTLAMGEDEETAQPLLNIKSQFEVPVFDAKSGERLENVDIYHGAEIIASIVVKEYEYRKKKGVTAYLRGIALIENGTPTSGTDFKSIMEGCL